MQNNHEQMIQQAYKGFNSRNIPAVLQLMHADVHWPKAFEGSYVQGHKAVSEYWTKQWAEIDPKVTPVGYSTRPDGSLVVEVHQLVKDLQGAILMDGNVKHIYTFADGLIKEMTVGAE